MLQAASPQLLYFPNNSFGSPYADGKTDQQQRSQKDVVAGCSRPHLASSGPETPPTDFETSPPVKPLWSTSEGTLGGFHTVFGDSLFGGIFPTDVGGMSTAKVAEDLLHPGGTGPRALRAGLLSGLKSGTFTTRSSRYHGVYRIPSGLWISQLTIHGTTIQLGSFGTEEEAARCWDKAVVQLHGSAQPGTNFWVHPATAAGWLKEKMPKQLASALHAVETAPNPGSARKKRTAALAAMAEVAEQEEEEEAAENKKASCSITEDDEIGGRPAHRRRKKA